MKALANRSDSLTKAPDHFTDRQKYYYKLYSEDLQGRRLLTRADVPNIERLALLEVEAERLLKQIGEEGATVTDKNGDQRRTAAVMALSNFSDQINKIKKALIISPEYRAKKEDPKQQAQQYVPLEMLPSEHEELLKYFRANVKKWSYDQARREILKKGMEMGLSRNCVLEWYETDCDDYFLGPKS